MGLFNKIFGIQTKQEICGIGDGQPSNVSVDIGDTQGLDVLAHISFMLVEGNDVQISSHWTRQDTDIAQLYALMLHHIFVGDLEELVISQLKHSAELGHIDDDFARSIYSELMKLKYQDDTNPVISPSQALKPNSLSRNEK